MMLSLSLSLSLILTEGLKHFFTNSMTDTAAPDTLAAASDTLAAANDTLERSRPKYLEAKTSGAPEEEGGSFGSCGREGRGIRRSLGEWENIVVVYSWIGMRRASLNRCKLTLCARLHRQTLLGRRI
jgi:hypothetical protein